MCVLQYSGGLPESIGSIRVPPLATLFLQLYYDITADALEVLDLITDALALPTINKSKFYGLHTGLSNIWAKYSPVNSPISKS